MSSLPSEPAPGPPPSLPSLPILTPRLLLRRFVPSDLEAVLAIFGPAEVARYLYSEPLDRQGAQAALNRRLEPLALDSDNQALGLALVERHSGDLVGELTVFYRSAQHRLGEIGYVLRPDAQGKGYAVEGARELLRVGFESFQLHRVIGRCDARNTASVAVMRKLGMRFEGHLVENEWVKGEWTDEMIFAMLDREWAAAALVG